MSTGNGVAGMTIEDIRHQRALAEMLAESNGKIEVLFDLVNSLKAEIGQRAKKIAELEKDLEEAKKALEKVKEPVTEAPQKQED
jgi:hypothetical protein